MNMNELTIENVSLVSGGHCGQESGARAAGCEIGYHLAELVDWLF